MPTIFSVIFWKGLAPALITLAILSVPSRAVSHGDLNLPPLPAPEMYGDVMIDRFCGEKKVLPVVFSHWVHRPLYTCRVCHVDMEFSMKSNDTGIVCNGGEMSGKFCTRCHNGKTAFAPKGPDGENCDKCHNADASPNRKKFNAMKERLPAAKYGNEIDWVKALADGLIKPKKSLSNDYTPVAMDRTLTLQAEMSGIPPAVFSHKTHMEWLDCGSCHPDIFNIKKKTTKHFSMSRILNNEFCGVCHLKIALPMNECRRCHPGMKK